MNILMEVMQSQLEAYRAFYDLSLKKKEAIVANDIEALNDIVSKEKGLLVQTEALEAKRVGQTARLGRILQINEPTLDDIIAGARPSAAAELKRLKQSFKALLEELRKLNETNARLLETHLSYIDFILNMTASGEAGNLYGHDGDIGDNRRTSLGILDTSV